MKCCSQWFMPSTRWKGSRCTTECHSGAVRVDTSDWMHEHMPIKTKILISNACRTEKHKTGGSCQFFFQKLMQLWRTIQYMAQGLCCRQVVIATYDYTALLRRRRKSSNFLNAEIWCCQCSGGATYLLRPSRNGLPETSYVWVQRHPLHSSS